ncbi:ABC transporter substrate-binding protein [Actinopolymorpha pittospori]|uniref:Multiple sugar transport system substrate-binding protein n=1 Tax=Actinopolymorpha pittospori TaxID=648752 RepID=A0A927N182_9ACTN|nr:sugar ABC transporter substrate-binding protein [Actinopolymorpha pittospori]MBE1610169.1 multiple sugar transport system substrate-binding protein [Actinopolymorpha pittospori]
MLPGAEVEEAQKLMERRAGMTRRGFIGAAGIGTVAAAASGCGVLPDGTIEGFVPATSKHTRIRLSVWGDVSDAAIYEKILNAWHQSQDTYRAKAEQYTGDYYAKVLANFAGGIPADVMYIQGWMWQPYAESRVLHPLDEFIERDGVRERWPNIENFTWNTRWKNQTYMAPVDGGSLVMYYNKDLFDKRRVPYPRPGWTWEEFQQMVPELTFTEGGKKYYGWAQAGGFLGAYGRAVPFMRRNGEVEWDRVVEPTKAMWNQPDIVSALQFTLCDAISKGWSPGPSAIQGGGISFATGRVAMVLEGPWYLPNLYGPLATTKAGINYDVVPPPAGTGGGNYSYAHIHGHVMAAQSTHKEGAWELIKFITGDVGQRIIAEGARMCATPTNVERIWAPIAGRDFRFHNTDAFVVSQREGTTPLVMGEGSPINAYGGEPLDSMWTALQSGQRSAAEIVEQYQPALQRVLDRYWAEREPSGN